MDNEFMLIISNEEQVYLRSLFVTNAGIKLHTKTNPGHIAPPEALGLEYDYMPIIGTNLVRITVTHNPYKTSIDRIKYYLESDLAKILSGRAKIRADHSPNSALQPCR